VALLAIFLPSRARAKRLRIKSNAFQIKAQAGLKRKTNKKSNKNDRGTSTSAGFLLVCGSEHTLSCRIRKVRIAQAVPTPLLPSPRLRALARCSDPCRKIAFKALRNPTKTDLRR
jgi:hypothetical protein